jgi:hypothetical protein
MQGHDAVTVAGADSGNPTGFRPSELVGPRDVFDMFDEDRSGQMDEDEFYFALDFLGIKVGRRGVEPIPRGGAGCCVDAGGFLVTGRSWAMTSWRSCSRPLMRTRAARSSTRSSSSAGSGESKRSMGATRECLLM